MNLKFPGIYWAISAGLILTGIVCMTAGAVRAESDRAKHLVQKEEVFADISEFDISVSKGKVILQKDPEITQCKVEISSISDSVKMDSQNEILQIRDTRKQAMQFVQFGFLSPVSTEIKITVPEQRYKQVKVKLDTGDCSVSGLQAEKLWIDSDVGNCKIADCEIEALKLETDTGETELKNSNIRQSCILKSDIGAVRAENLSCSGKTEIELGTGDCRIENAVFSGNVQAESDIGAMNLQNITLDGSLHLDADTGDVSVSVNGEEENFVFECFSDLGPVSLDHRETGNIQNRISDADQRNKIKISTDIGSIDLCFLKNK